MKKWLGMLLFLFLTPIPLIAQQKPLQLPQEVQFNSRFVIWSNPNVRADTFLLDTWTGRVWELLTYTDIEGKPRIWQYMVRVDTPKELLDWLRPTERRPSSTQERMPSGSILEQLHEFRKEREREEKLQK